ncbi:hypothetical protein SR187_8205 [Streptococcus ruminantium]|uniref:Uncharacterized protein n=1 Tax=Streptococcus ruminantium TaxID=1917441 RepID=A0A2Z5TSX2_9STRE|nr:hypothetical protein SR187_8205 [Streptococcus ruminantium]
MTVVCSASPDETAYGQFLYLVLAQFSKNIVLKISHQESVQKIRYKGHEN